MQGARKLLGSGQFFDTRLGIGLDPSLGRKRLEQLLRGVPVCRDKLLQDAGKVRLRVYSVDFAAG